MTQGLFVDPRELAILEEGRQAVAIAELADESESIAGGTMSYAGPNVWANQVCGIGLRAPMSDDDLDRVVSFYDARDEPGEIEIAAHADATCFAGLGRRGFFLSEIESVFAIAAERIPADYEPLPGLELQRVESLGESSIQEFIEVGTRGFKKPGEKVKRDEEKLLRRVIEHPRSSSWIVRFEGEVCGVTAMECAGEVACLFATTVRPEFRRRGIQRALMEARLLHGRAAGCRYVCIHSAAGIATERNALRLGMRIAYAKAILTRTIS